MPPRGGWHSSLLKKITVSDATWHQRPEKSELIADAELEGILETVAVQLAADKGVLVVEREEHLLVVQLRTDLGPHRELIVRTIVPGMFGGDACRLS